MPGRVFPSGDWEQPAERLDELYRWVEDGALWVIDWYLTDRRRKRRWARLLRLGAALGAVTGAALPLLELAGVLGAGLGVWGYPALLAAAACVAGDRFFGLTSGWMRDMATAQAVRRRLEELQYDWATESVREVLGPTEGSAGEAAERCLAVLRRFTEDVSGLVRAETSDWMVEFRVGAPSVPTGVGGVAVAREAGCGGRHPECAPAAPVNRFPSPPGVRANMPRQRPPER
ncbi:SLATT domain-containing protein [Streptomyces sp. NPDC005438]|uniref:SLATT domain-containing protein n=1 Tax=Streptomyces sp. NPDC005438 TaxID=3156880 RepID=UPI0033AED698